MVITKKLISSLNINDNGIKATLGNNKVKEFNDLTKFGHIQYSNDKKSHILICGTGRCGTTFIAQLLTLLNIPTGFNHIPEEHLIDHGDKVRDHLEPYFIWQDLKKDSKKLENSRRLWEFPYVFKSPTAIEYIEELRTYMDLKHVIIPMRKIEDVMVSAKVMNFPDETFNIRNMEKILAHSFYTLTRYNIPFTTIHFPTLVKDCDYLYDKLNPIFAERNIDFETFNGYFNALTEKKQ